MSKPVSYAWLISLIFPLECRGCQKEGNWLCQSCLRRLKTTGPSDRCYICNQAGQQGLCGNCRKETELDGLISFYEYSKNGPISSLIKEGKYTGQFDAIKFLAKECRSRVWRSLPNGDWTIGYIPLSRNKLLQRGYNQSEIIAESIGSNIYPIFYGLTKTKDTPAQAELTRKRRKRSFRNIYQVSRKTALPERVLLCDDVVTTGSTLRAVARTLKKQGVKDVWAFTLAHG